MRNKYDTGHNPNWQYFKRKCSLHILYVHHNSSNSNDLGNRNFELRNLHDLVLLRALFELFWSRDKNIIGLFTVIMVIS
jgi:hypothetical protein